MIYSVIKKNLSEVLTSVFEGIIFIRLGKVQRNSTHQLFWRFLVVGLLISIYLSVDWTMLRLILRDIVSQILNYLEYTTTPIGNGEKIYMLINSKHLLSFSKHCLCLDLVFIISPFYWHFRKSLKINVIRQLFLVLILVNLNLLRIVFAIYFYDKGLSWQFAHHLPNLVLYIIVISLTVLPALKRHRILNEENIIQTPKDIGYSCIVS